MGKNRFVVPDTARVELSDGDWIEIKERLTYGEQQRLAGGALTRMSGTGDGAAIDLDFERYNLLRMETWLVDWSFVGANGKPVKLSRAAIAALDPDTAAEIDAALTKHIEEIEAAKNPPASPGNAT
jgi:hypothetical protein